MDILLTRPCLAEFWLLLLNSTECSFYSTYLAQSNSFNQQTPDTVIIYSYFRKTQDYCRWNAIFTAGPSNSPTTRHVHSPVIAKEPARILLKYRFCLEPNSFIVSSVYYSYLLKFKYLICKHTKRVKLF